MVVSGTLYTYPDNFRAFKALIAAQYAGSNVTLSPNFVFGETNKTEAFLKKFPSGKVPAFEGSDGITLSEGNSIAYYVANNQLRGKNEKQQAEILQWISFADLTVTPAASAWLFPIIGIMPFNKQTIDRAKEDTKEFLRILNIHLSTRTYLVGERITLADICVACSLISLYDKLLEPSFRQPYQNTNRWFTTIVNQPQVRAVIGNFELCNKAAEFDPKKYQEFLAKTGGGAAKKDKKEKKEKKEEKPQPAKKEKKPEPEEELDAADAVLALEPKSKDPFDSMPKGTFNMDDFKRCYSNEDESKSIAYFWEKFDPENYSIWFGEYKYSDELAKVFMSCNLITGMFQRLDKMRKQAFASVCLFGEDNNSTISGIWVWRGHDLAFELSPDWQIDYESYSWKKLDASAQTTKDLVTQYFSWTGTDKGGRKFNQGKIFK